jgi:ferrochelatase
VFYNHPGFIETMTERVEEAFGKLPEDRRAEATLLFTAHSIPISMSDTSPYLQQLQEACRLVAERVARPDYRLVYQSRSGPPGQPWLEPDILAVLRELAAAGGSRDLIVAPIGFTSDHMEVLYDLDTEAAQLCGELGLNMVRAGTVGASPRFIAMIRDLVIERRDAAAERPALGQFGAWPDVCPADCCAPPKRMGRP